MTTSLSTEAKPTTSQRPKSEDAPKGQNKKHTIGDLEDVEARLYLIEKARIQGIVGYKQAPKEERHGDSYYWVDRVPGGIRVRCKVGGLTYSEAQSRKDDAISRIALTDKAIEGLKAAKLHHEQSPEILEQMTGKIAVLLESKEKDLAIVSESDKVPEPYTTEKVIPS